MKIGERRIVNAWAFSLNCKSIPEIARASLDSGAETHSLSASSFRALSERVGETDACSAVSCPTTIVVFCILKIFTNSGNSAYWQYASSTRAQTIPYRFGSQAVTGDQPSSQHTPRNCSPRRHCPGGGRGNCQSRSGTQPIYVSAHGIAVAEAISQRRHDKRTIVSGTEPPLCLLP